MCTQKSLFLYWYDGHFRAIISRSVMERTPTAACLTSNFFIIRELLCPQLSALSPALITRETLAGVLTAPALIPEVISFSVIAGVDPQVSLIASVVLCLAMSVLGGRPAMVTAAAGSVAPVIGPMVHQHGVGYILPAVILAGIIQIFVWDMRYGAVNALYPATGDDRVLLMR